MVETWNITRGRVGAPAPSAPDGGTPGAPLPRWVLVATLRRTQTRLLYARLGRAPRGVSAPRLSAGRACRPDQRTRPSLFAHSASPLAPGPLPLRGAASARRARRRFAGPVRRIPPSAPLGPRRPRPSRLPPGAPATRLRGRLAPAPGGARGLWAALFCAPPPGAFFLARVRAGSGRGPPLLPRSLFSPAVPGRQVLPQAPSRPPPPPGAGGGARLICGWLRRFLPPGFRGSL